MMSMTNLRETQTYFGMIANGENHTFAVSTGLTHSGIKQKSSNGGWNLILYTEDPIGANLLEALAALGTRVPVILITHVTETQVDQVGTLLRLKSPNPEDRNHPRKSGSSTGAMPTQKNPGTRSLNDPRHTATRQEALKAKAVVKSSHVLAGVEEIMSIAKSQDPARDHGRAEERHAMAIAKRREPTRNLLWPRRKKIYQTITPF